MPLRLHADFVVSSAKQLSQMKSLAEFNIVEVATLLGVGGVLKAGATTVRTG